MSDSSVKGSSSSCLAITEKKKNNKRPGGCIGSIFFQLFTNNRLFSKKLLTPARAKQASSKKFKGDEKMFNSKLHLIANENNGGFPSAKKGGNRLIEVEPKSNMRVPGLVARLMGLESVPALQRDESKKSSFSDTFVGDDENANEKHVVDLETGVANHDSRHQKLQRTEACDRMAVTRFGADALQMKGVLSRARKYNHHHHPKPPSPLKSPRITSGKSATRSSRLIGAAARILEPGLQARGRARCALASSASVYPPNDGIATKSLGTMSEDTMFQSGYEARISNSSMAHSSCRNCGNLLDVVDCRPQVLEHPAVPPPRPNVWDVLDVSSLVSGLDRRPFLPCHEHDVVLLRSQEKVIPIAIEEHGKSNAYSCNESTSRRMPSLGESPNKCSSSQKPSRSLEDDDFSSFAFRHKTQAQEYVLRSERISSASRVSNVLEKRVSSAASTESGTKDFVALNRSLSGRTRMRSPTKADSSKFDLERKPYSRPDDTLSRGRTLERKRSISLASVNSVTAKQRSISSDVQKEKMRGFNASSPNSSNVKIRRGGPRRTDQVNEVVSFTFNSPSKKKVVIPEGKEEASTDCEIKTFFLKPPPPLRAEDAIGAFLEKKLKELCSQEDEELSTGGQSRRSTAMILQELISALSSEEHLASSDDLVFEDKHEANQERLLGTPCNGNHLSPGSVLQASLSSGSLDESSGHGFHPKSTNCSYHQPERHEHDIETELLGSATSFNEGKTGCEMLIELVNQIPRILQSSNSFGTRLTKSKLTHMKDVILNAELVLGNVGEHGEDGAPKLLFSHFLPNEPNSVTGDAIGCEDSKAIFFDCVIEYLESNCCQQHYNSLFKAWTASSWTKLPLRAKAEILVQEVKREIKKWTCVAGMLPDEIIEWEMSHSFRKSTDFNIEAFEAGVDIDGEVLHILINEIVEDLVDSI